MSNPLSSKSNKVTVTNDALSDENLERMASALGIATQEDAAIALANSKIDANEFIALNSLFTRKLAHATATGKPKARPAYATKRELLAAMPDSVDVVLAGTSGKSSKREFSTGGIGYHWQGKITIDGVTYQASAMLTAIGSKLLPA